MACATTCIVVDDGSTDDTVSGGAASRGQGDLARNQPRTRRRNPHRSRGSRRRRVRRSSRSAMATASTPRRSSGLSPHRSSPVLADYVVGSRFAGEIRHMQPHRRLGNIVLTRWVRWMVRLRVTDGQSGFRALSWQAAAAAELIHDYNYAQVLDARPRRQGLRVRRGADLVRVPCRADARSCVSFRTCDTWFPQCIARSEVSPRRRDRRTTVGISIHRSRSSRPSAPRASTTSLAHQQRVVRVVVGEQRLAAEDGEVGMRVE